ncbi:abortive infection family protein [Nitrospira sp. T9]|uniref:abortive infection family protein n=1 Tax=unclassified Nitrospira TaxID=2652172 RepID=UPI003F98F77E
MASSSPADVFVMHGARTAIAAGLLHIKEQVNGIERAVGENPGLAFDLARTVVESTCRTILTERKVGYNSDDDLPGLFKMVTTNLPMLPVTASSEAEARKSLMQTLNGLHTALQGICKLRNAYGFASHGSEGTRPIMETVQALLAAQAADAIIGFLHRIHRQQENTHPTERFEYGDNVEFNAYLDEANEEVQIFELTYRPSEVLFAVDLDAYRDLLTNYEPTDEDKEPAPIPNLAEGSA